MLFFARKCGDILRRRLTWRSNVKIKPLLHVGTLSSNYTEILSKRDNSYSLRERETTVNGRYKSRFMKDFLAYIIMMKLGDLQWQDDYNFSFKELKKRLTAKNYCKDSCYDSTTASILRHRNNDYVYS